MNGIKTEVEEKGLSRVPCLICLEKIPSNIFNKEHLNSLNSFLSYLEISEEFKALFICLKCEKDITKLLKLYTILEKVKLEMDNLLDFIQNVASKSNKKLNGKTSFSFASARDAIIRKCESKIAKPKPVISLQKLDISKYVRKKTPIIDNSDDFLPDWDDASTPSDSDSDACENPLTSAIKQEINSDQELKPTITKDTPHLQFLCTLCKKSYKSRNALYKHHQFSHREKTFKCKTCNKSYSTAAHLRRHISFIHKHDMKYCKASGCGKSYAHLVPLSHYKLEHPGFTVPRLPHPNTNNEYLEKYTVINLKGDKIVECKLCKKRYRNKTLFIQHFRNVHAFKNLRCEYCNYATSVKAHLKRHITCCHKS